MRDFLRHFYYVDVNGRLFIKDNNVNPILLLAILITLAVK